MNTPGISEAASAKVTRLSLFEVHGLFGAFYYRIPIKLEQRITAIIAPNGSGKTICLRLINALFTRKWSLFSGVEFERVEYHFTSGERLTISKVGDPSEQAGGGLAGGIQIRLVDANRSVTSWKPAPDPKIRAQPIERYVGFLTRQGPNLFTHDYTDATYTFAEVVETFSEHLPETYRNSLFGMEPPQIAAITGAIDCHLIETQRLLVLKDDAAVDPYRRSRQQQSTLAISAKAQTLVEVIRRELTAYAALSQSLDRSFPKRVIGFGMQDVLPAENLKSQLDELDQKRASLMVAGILDSEIDDPVTLPEGPLEPAIARVLNVYADDTFKKLNSLSKLRLRIELFLGLIKERFNTKRIQVSKESGFSINSRGSVVPLEKLSSGEQHQLVLFFELLFELKENALILIDEPELSLHVAWQKKFVSDLNRIIELNQFDVILATHSPQLVSRWNDLVVELGDVDEVEDE
jgi:AAA domain, putative AbiEii toxin, Type IV TA system